MRPLATAVALLMVFVVPASAGAAWWWRDQRHAAVRSASVYADGVAAALAEGRLPSGVGVADRGAAQEDLDRILAGMGSLEHRVQVRAVELRDGDAEGRVVLAHAWRVHADKVPWTYETTLPIERTGNSWRGDWSPDVVAPGLADDERIRAIRLDPERADVLGDGGATLVTAREVVRLGIDRTAVPETPRASRSAELLAKLVGIDPESFASRVAGSGPKAFVEAITYRASAGELTDVAAQLDGIPGATTVDGTLPLSPTSSFARPILGTAGQATAEIIERSGGRLRAGDVVGLSGLQGTYDESLAGVPGYVVEAVQLDNDEARPLHTVPARDGTPLRLTLSTEHQTAAEAALESIESASAIVAIRPSDGHVLAAASGPGSQGYSTATLGQYPPGSTFKAVSTLALLRAGLTEQSAVDCSPNAVVDGRRFKNFDDYPTSRLGTISLRTAFANSCNTALMKERGRLRSSSLPDAAASLGLTADPALGVPAALGSVPAPEGDVETAAAMIGQGTVLSTPLGMAVVAASVRQGGPVSPLLVVDDTTSRPAAERGLSDGEHRQMLSMLRAVVTDGGATLLGDVPGGPIAAKTGTAEFGRPDQDGDLQTHAWMIAIQDDLAVAVFVERGSGAAVAGPALKDFLTSLHAKP